MRFIMNSLDEEQTVSVGGKHFSFKGKQIKPFQSEDIASFILRDRADLGFVEIPQLVTEDESAVGDYDKSPAGLSLIEEKRRQGIEAYCARLRKTVYNLQVSLKKDLAIKNMNIDPMHYATDKEVQQMEHLVKYQTRKEDPAQSRVDRAKKLEKALEKI